MSTLVVILQTRILILIKGIMAMYRILLILFFLTAQVTAMMSDFEETSCYNKAARKVQNWSYQLLSITGAWDYIIDGFKPARAKAIDLLELQPTDKILLIGEGSGLDFEVLPKETAKEHVWALDYSSEMIKAAKKKAQLLGFPEDQCIVGDAQALPFIEEKFNKIFFPLSLGSIPNPTLAIKEAERVLLPNGKIVILEKLVDDEESISYVRKGINFFTRFIFADINRNLTQMVGPESPLKTVYYESTQGLLTGFLGRIVSPYYRLAILARDNDFPDITALDARIEQRIKLE